jgi:hypothetical protein
MDIPICKRLGCKAVEACPHPPPSFLSASLSHMHTRTLAHSPFLNGAQWLRVAGSRRHISDKARFLQIVIGQAKAGVTFVSSSIWGWAPARVIMLGAISLLFPWSREGKRNKPRRRRQLTPKPHLPKEAQPACMYSTVALQSEKPWRLAQPGLAIKILPAQPKSHDGLNASFHARIDVVCDPI